MHLTTVTSIPINISIDIDGLDADLVLMILWSKRVLLISNYIDTKETLFLSQDLRVFLLVNVIVCSMIFITRMIET
jgi:hypothetical protein